MRFAAVAALSVVAGCTAPDAFVCQQDSQCGAEGRCEVDGYCSGIDADCMSGRRYFEHSGNVAGQCVPPTEPEEGSTSTTGEDVTTLDPSTSSTSASTTSASSTTSPVDSTSTTTSTVDSTGSTGSEGGIDPDLVAWYRMEDVTTEGTPDSSGNGLGAICAMDQCALSAQGIGGSGALYDGVDDMHAIANDPLLSLPDGFTVMGWGRFAPGTLNTFSHLLAKPEGDMTNNSFELFYRDDLLRFTFKAGLTVVSLTVTEAPSEWFHLAGTYDGQSMALYVDGVKVGEEASLGAVPFDDHDMFIGADVDAGVAKNFFLGTIDDVRVYRRALTEAEVAEIVAVP